MFFVFPRNIFEYIIDFLRHRNHVVGDHVNQDKEFYQRLVKAGKTKMTAVTACMRKILTILNVMVAKKEYWKSELYA